MISVWGVSQAGVQDVPFSIDGKSPECMVWDPWWEGHRSHRPSRMLLTAASLLLQSWFHVVYGFRIWTHLLAP